MYLKMLYIGLHLQMTGSDKCLNVIKKITRDEQNTDVEETYEQFEYKYKINENIQFIFISDCM